MLLHYEDANELCIQAAENIAQECNEKGKQLENLATVMTLYSRRNFSKESFQWTKCVVKYLHDSYAPLTPSLMGFLVEVLEKGPSSIQNPILNILHCMLHYIDVNATAAQLINGDLLRVVAKYIESSHWKEALRILKLAVSRSSSLVVPPAASQSSYWEQHTFTDLEAHFKKELPGRTMEFTFDVTQTPIIGRRFLTRSNQSVAQSITSSEVFNRDQGAVSDRALGDKDPVSPQRSLSFSAADTAQITGWKRPWLSQARVRERLVNLLNTCGQRVGLPKSPSVIFSQSSELERQSSMASSTEEVSVAPGEAANDRIADDMTSSEKQFAVFKDFDFLEYELESQGEESMDNFNLWGVRRRSPSHGGDPEPASQVEDPHSDITPSHKKKSSKVAGEREWWEEEGSISPSDDRSLSHTERSSGPSTMQSHPPPAPTPPVLSSPPKLTLDTSNARRPLSPNSMSDQSESSEGDLGDMTPCNASPSIAPLLFRPLRQPNSLEDTWHSHLLSLMTPGMPILNPQGTCCLFSAMFKDCVVKFCDIAVDGSQYLSAVTGAPTFLKQMEVIGSTASLPYIYLDSFLLTFSGFTQKFRSTFIALNEHLDTYLDKQDNAFVCLDSIRSTLKLQGLNDSIHETSPDDQQLELCKCLYKLNFQLSLLYETYTKFLAVLLQFAQTIQANDHSIELEALRAKLVAAWEELDATPPSSPSRLTTTPVVERQMPEGEEGETESVGGDEGECESIEEESTLLAIGLGEISEETHSPISFGSQTSTSPQTSPVSSQQAHHQILQLVADQEWTKAIRYVRRNRNLWPSEQFCTVSFDDITIILNVYCSYLSDKKPGMIAVCGFDHPMEEVNKLLTEANMTALSALGVMEQSAKQSKEKHESTIRKTEC
ncbi:Protein furry [Armadillidium nasatum]|uniref:Protein furry n=1 Tax=Armadillidium nasatum TaxID=96803 RepID=A0A5N5TDJ6_9CRUS|nr:Protein furry [Armadillidium nasatum]